jgi:tRNA modification GTPase
VVLNKIDLLENSWRSNTAIGAVAECPRREPQLQCTVLDASCVPISARTGEGLEQLEAAIIETVLSGQISASEAPLVTSPRHRQALNQALDHVDGARAGYDAGQLTDMLAIDVTAAVNALGEITGQTASEDLLETIFGSFCIGK